MLFTATHLPGAFLLEIEKHEDDRGFFARTFCVHEFETHGLNPRVVQCSTAFNLRRGTLRGMHFQAPPMSEVKLVRCVRGAIHDVIVDLRLDSPTYKSHLAVELTADNRRAVYIPQEFAHGFQTLADETEVLYHISEFYTPGSGRGFRYDDPAFGIHWPLPVSVISAQDLHWQAFS